MSKKKWGFKKLASIRRTLSRGYAIEDIVPERNAFDGIPIDWYEFNKLYFSSRPVVVECPYGMWDKGDVLMSLYAGLRMARDNRALAVFSDSNDARVLKSDGFYECLAGKKEWKPKCDRFSICKGLDQLNPDVADDWIAYANWSGEITDPYVDAHNIVAFDILEWIERTNGFKDFMGSVTTPQYYRHTVYPKKFVVLWDSANKDDYIRLKEKFGDKFVFLDYTKEKKLVDDWFKENDTMLDPMFDIRMMEPGMDMRKILSYMATNHIYNLREYAKLFPEVVDRHFSKDDLSDMGCKFGSGK